MIAVYLLILIVTFYLLSLISDKFFVKSLEKISEKLKLSSEVTGATFMAIGSSAPELFTSIFAIFTIFGSGGNENIGSGTIVGSAIFNVLIIIGLSLIYTTKNKKLHWQPIIRDLIFYTFTIGLLIWSFWDGQVSFIESCVFVFGYFSYVFIVAHRSKRLNYNVDENLEENLEENQEIQQSTQEKKIEKIISYLIPSPENHYWTSFFVSIAFIGLLSHEMVQSAVKISQILQIPNTIIGLTILAAGTSIPDAISSVIVAKKGKISMSFTNALGSNIFDILFGLGTVYFFYFLIYGIDKTIVIDNHNLLSSVFLLFATVLVVFSVLVLKKWKTNRSIGFFLLLVYLGYLGYMIYTVL